MQSYGFNEFQSIMLRIIEREFPEEVERELIKLADQGVTDTKLKTPVDTGELRNSMQRDDPKKLGSNYQIELGTNKDYAEPVEKGYVTPSGGFKPGVHMLETSINKLNRELPQEIEQWLEGVFREFRL